MHIVDYNITIMNTLSDYHRWLDDILIDKWDTHMASWGNNGGAIWVGCGTWWVAWLITYTIWVSRAVTSIIIVINVVISRFGETTPRRSRNEVLYK